MFDFLERLDIGVKRVIQVTELIHFLDQRAHDRLNIGCGMKTQDIASLFGTYLVIAEVLDVFDYQV